jgi:hypothetical protein
MSGRKAEAGPSAPLKNASLGMTGAIPLENASLGKTRANCGGPSEVVG